MNHARMPLLPALLLALVIGSTGCVQRTITIESDPAGALVYLNDVEVGRTPVTVPFTFYGTYDVRLEREGYQTLNTAEGAEAPWWEAPGPDLFAEMVPDNQVNLRWFYVMEQLQPVDTAGLVNRGQRMRDALDAPVDAPLIDLPAPRPEEPTPAPPAPTAPESEAPDADTPEAPAPEPTPAE